MMEEEGPAAASRTWNNEQAAGEDLPGALVVTPPTNRPTGDTLAQHCHSLSHLHWGQLQQAAKELDAFASAAPLMCREEGGGGVRAGVRKGEGVCGGDIIFLLHTLSPPRSSRSSSLFLRLFNTSLVFLSHLPLSSAATLFSALSLSVTHTRTHVHVNMHTHVHAPAGLFFFSPAKLPGKTDNL